MSPDTAARAAEARADARAALAVATHRAEGSPVRAYRSRGGRAYPGYAPTVTRATPDAPGGYALVRDLGLNAPASLADVREWDAFDPRTARLAHRLVSLATVRHAFERADGDPDYCACGARRDDAPHAHAHEGALRVTKARRMHAAIDARTLRVYAPVAALRAPRA